MNWGDAALPSAGVGANEAMYALESRFDGEERRMERMKSCLLVVDLERLIPLDTHIVIVL